MANLSQETLAILDRLKAEGDLVRNSGTNSIRSVNIKLDKFDSVFSAINLNIAEQTKIMQRQLGIAESAAEAASAKEQLEEIQPKSTETEKQKEIPEKDTSDTDAKIDSMSESIKNALSLKNLALGAGALFVGYNMLKGFINEKYNGAWDDMEEGLAGLGPKLREFSKIDFNAIRQDFLDFKTTIGDLRTTLADLNTKFESILNMNWIDIASNVLLALNGLGLAIAGLRWWFTRQRLAMLRDPALSPRNGNPWWRRVLGLPEQAPRTPTTPTTPSQPYEDEIMRRQRTGRTGTTPQTSATGGGRGTYGMNTPAERAQLRADAAASRAGNRAGLRLNNAGRLVNGSGQFVSDAQALDIMQRSLNPKYSKVFANLVKIFKLTGLALAVYTAFQIYTILSDENLDDEGKMRALAPILGSALGAVGGGIIGAAIGTMGGVTAGWGTLLLGLAGSIAGGLAGEQLGYYVAKWAFDEDPEEQLSEIRNTQPPTAFDEFSGMSPDDYVAMYGNSTTGAGVPLTTPMTPTRGAGAGRGTMYERPGEREAYLREQEGAMLDALIEAERQNQQQQREIDEMRQYLDMIERGESPVAQLSSLIGSNAGTQAPIIIDAKTIAPSTFSMTDGGTRASITNISSGLGGGSVGHSLSPYGLTSAWT